MPTLRRLLRLVASLIEPKGINLRVATISAPFGFAVIAIRYDSYFARVIFALPPAAQPFTVNV